MKSSVVCLILVNLINVFHALVCPIYLPRTLNFQQPTLIQTCQSNCTYHNVTDKFSACLGVYYNSSGAILIKQLGVIFSDRQCSTSKQCILDVDALNPQSFSCCCSSDNCTLDWRSVSTTTTTTTTSRSMLIHQQPAIKNVLNTEQNYFSWKLLLLLFLFFMIILLIILTIALWKSLRNHPEKKDQNALIKSTLTPAISIESFFASAQQIAIGKNSLVYKGIWNHELVAWKVYKPTNMLIWQNEMTLLKSIKHDSIIKYVSFGGKVLADCHLGFSPTDSIIPNSI